MEQPTPIPIPAFVRGVKTLVDGSLIIDFETQDLTPEAATYIFAQRRKTGYVIFMENPAKAEDIDLPEVAPEFKHDKTPSQRLRNVLHVYWEQMSQAKPATFEEFYRAEMERITNHYKAKLQP